MQEEHRARPTYSSFRTTILKLTPDELKCKLYCKGAVCKYCSPRGFPKEKQALDGLYSTWVTSDILAMARPLKEHFVAYDLIGQFARNNIRTVFNLEQLGEHPFCGPPLLDTGFTYDPEELMKRGIYYYNFPFPDFEACSTQTILDVVKVVAFALKEGKIAIHCHAGHGRTGMLIAALFIYQFGMRPAEAVSRVRSHRPQSVQSTQQVDILNKMQRHLDVAGQTIPKAHSFNTVDDALDYQKQFIAGPEKRMYAHIPKVPYTICMRLLSLFYRSVSFSYGDSSTATCTFYLVVDHPYDSKLDETSLTTFIMNLLERRLFTNFQTWYDEKTEKQSMTIVNLESYIGDCSISILLCFLDLFMRSFCPMYTEKSLKDILINNTRMPIEDCGAIHARNSNDYLLFFFLHVFSTVLPHFHPELAMVISQWFTGLATVQDETSDVLLAYMRKLIRVRN